jgi:hypothetical protein
MTTDLDAYIRREGLDKLINFGEYQDVKIGVMEHVSGKLATPFRPEKHDLVRLHRLIRSRRSFTVLEFGTGYSTAVMADALQKNETDWNRLQTKPDVRNRFMFQLFVVDASEKWMEVSRKRIPAHLADRVHFKFSEIEISTYNHQLCHYYKSLPDVVADFIYLDGPSAKDVKGEINGLSFRNCEERTVMSADLLLMESTFLPGTYITVDGRTNNARFLARNFQRKYDISWDTQADATNFELKEERLGMYNILGSDYF